MNLGVGETIILLVSGPLIFFYFLRMIAKRSSSKLPPGPYPWPIVGNLFQLGKNAHVRLAEMAQVYGPLISLRLGHRILIVGSSSAMAAEILKIHDNVLSGRDIARFLPGIKDPNVVNRNLVFSSECDDGWRHFRNIYTSKIFSSSALESRVKLRENKVMEMVKHISSKGGEHIIMIEDVMFIIAVNILGNVSLSMDLVDLDGNGIGASIKDTVRRISTMATQTTLTDLYPILGRWDLQGWHKQVMHLIEKDLGVIWEDILQKKRKGSNISPGLNDFTDTLIEKGFTNLQINALMEELFTAGTESQSFTTEWFISELLKNQQAMQKAQDEITKKIEGNVVKESDLASLPYLEACFKETLRLHPPAPLLLPHRAIETCEVMGFTVPKDCQILVNVWAISRDPKTWDDPLSFKPERFIGSKLSYKGKDFEYLPFGAGRRMCPAEAMASKTILLTVASLILNFDCFLPNNVNPCDINMDEILDIPTHRKEPLQVTLKLRDRFKN